MNRVKYIGLDVHQATIVAAVLDDSGKLVMQSILETKATAILEFLHGLSGTLQVTFEEGTWSTWLHDLLLPHVAKLVVCNPRKNALLKDGSKSDKIDARKLAELLRADMLSPVYHRDSGVRQLKELARSYSALTKDTIRVMNRLKSLYRSRAIACAGRQVYAPRQRALWLERLSETGQHRRAEPLCQQLDALQALRQQARRDLLREARRHPAASQLRQVPCFGPVRVALFIAQVQTPFRFRSKRQFWTYCGLAVETHGSAEYRFVAGQLARSKRAVLVRGLNDHYNHELKNVLKGATTLACSRPGPFHDFYLALLDKGMKPAMARLTLTRKMAAVTLLLWKKGERFDAQQLKPQAA